MKLLDMYDTLSGKNVPLQNHNEREIRIEIAQEAYKEYQANFGNDQTFERLQDRGGFGIDEICMLLYARIKRLESK